MGEKGRVRGFTLVELALVLLVAAILAAISVSVYRRVLHRARTTQARTALGHLRKTQALFFTENGKYTDTLGALGFEPARYDYYRISVTLTDNNQMAFKGFAHGQGAMSGDLWTVTDNTDPVQDANSPFR